MTASASEQEPADLFRRHGFDGSGGERHGTGRRLNIPHLVGS